MSRIACLPGFAAVADGLGKVLAEHGYVPGGLTGERIAPDHYEAAVLARNAGGLQTQ